MNALRITRETLGNDPNQIAAVIAANRAQPNMPAGQIAAGMDVGYPTYQAAIRMAERVDPASQAWRAAEVAREANRTTLATLAGGETQTQARASVQEGRKALNRATTPLREEAFADNVEPLRVDTLTSAIDAQLRKPEIVANQQLVKALNNVKEMALGFANGSDFLGAPEYYALRKNGIDSAVRAALGQQGEASAVKKLTASILTTVKNDVDPKLGPKFKTYLDAYSEGARELSKQKLAAEALKLYEQGDKKAFINLVQGNDPKRVLKIMGGGVEDIAEAMGADYPKLAAIAKQTQEEITANTRAGEGATALTGVLARNQLNARIPNSLSPKIMVANKVLSGLEGRVNAKTMVALTKAAQSGASMNDLLMLTPPSERSKVLSALRNLPQTTNAMSPYLINRLAPTAPSGVQQQ
jgi:hypothetical protein